MKLWGIDIYDVYWDCLDYADSEIGAYRLASFYSKIYGDDRVRIIDPDGDYIE